MEGNGTRSILIATRNSGKLRELASLLAGTPFRCVSLDDAGVKGAVPESGATFEENASIKATEYARLSGMLTLSDDSGLEVDALGGEPGVMSARYAGDDATDAERIAFLLGKLKNMPDEALSARFRCVIAIARPGGPAELHSGTCEGRIARSPRGGGGFGYDPIFLLSGLGKTMAELSPDEKNMVSHRSIAARRAAEALRTMAAHE